MTAYSAEPVAPAGVEQPEEPQPIETPADTEHCPVVPSADPTTPRLPCFFQLHHNPPLESRGVEDYHIHFRVLSSMLHFATLTTSRACLLGDGSSSCSSEQIIATRTQIRHSEAI
ncbi:hypothetical protein AAG906_001786 [Vitis piasezkii]